jgi:hypothetical protein
MKPIIDQKKVNQRKLLANVASTGGLLILLGSVVLPTFTQIPGTLVSLIMVGGLAVSMIGIYFANRWVKKPRPEESLDHALKGLSDAHYLFHYPSLPSDHILLTPYCVVILETINLEGFFTYKDGKWKEQITIGRALRFIVEEHLGDPIKAAKSSLDYLKGFFAEKIPSGDSIPMKSIVVFTHPRVTLELENPPITVCQVARLRKHIPEKLARLPADQYDQLFSLFNKRTIQKIN